ncbi:MAG: hypothetical protein ACFFDN_00345 [Candidatus Hodarchaeota archaeon]
MEQKQPEKVEYETLEFKLPKTLLPVLDIISKVSGYDRITFLLRFVYRGLIQVCNEPHNLFDHYTNFEKSEFFKAFKIGLNQFYPETKS